MTAEEEIEAAKKIFNEKGYELIFLATDEEEAVAKFKETFGDKLRFFEDVKRGSEKDDSVAFSATEPGSRYRLGYEVIRDQYFLTRAEGLVCGISNLTVAARVLKKAWYDTGYEDLVVIEHGFNKNDNSFSKARH